MKCSQEVKFGHHKKFLPPLRLCLQDQSPVPVEQCLIRDCLPATGMARVTAVDGLDVNTHGV